MIGHRYRVSVRLDVAGQAPETDQVGDTVDYAKVAQTIEVVSSSHQYLTVERLAQAMGQALLGHFPLVESVWLRVEKRLPPAEMMAESAGVEIVLKR